MSTDETTEPNPLVEESDWEGWEHADPAVALPGKDF